jgi:hypothetical protein
MHGESTMAQLNMTSQKLENMGSTRASVLGEWLKQIEIRPQT